MSKAKAEELGLEWIAEIGAHGNVAGPDNSLQSQPSNAILHALKKEGLAVADLDLIEINEAFAAVAVQSMKDLGVSPEKVNVNGGAIALGHPIGMSGARLVLHLALELQAARRRRRRGRAVRRRRPGRRADRPRYPGKYSEAAYAACDGLAIATRAIGNGAVMQDVPTAGGPGAGRAGRGPWPG